MAITFNLIASTTLTGTASAIEFSSLPTSYDDLVLKVVVRSDRAGQINSSARVTFNNTTSNNTTIQILRDKTSPNNVNTETQGALIYCPAATWSANFFAHADIYIPSYREAKAKTYSLNSGAGQNVTNNVFGQYLSARWNDTSAITTVTLTEANGANFVAGTTATLYGIKRS